jgi:hypothetical protein
MHITQKFFSLKVLLLHFSFHDKMFQSQNGCTMKTLSKCQVPHYLAGKVLFYCKNEMSRLKTLIPVQAHM